MIDNKTSRVITLDKQIVSFRIHPLMVTPYSVDQTPTILILSTPLVDYDEEFCLTLPYLQVLFD